MARAPGAWRRPTDRGRPGRRRPRQSPGRRTRASPSGPPTLTTVEPSGGERRVGADEADSPCPAHRRRGRRGAARRRASRCPGARARSTTGRRRRRRGSAPRCRSTPRWRRSSSRSTPDPVRTASVPSVGRPGRPGRRASRVPTAAVRHADRAVREVDDDDRVRVGTRRGPTTASTLPAGAPSRAEAPGPSPGPMAVAPVDRRRPGGGGSRRSRRHAGPRRRAGSRPRRRRRRSRPRASPVSAVADRCAGPPLDEARLRRR